MGQIAVISIRNIALLKMRRFYEEKTKTIYGFSLLFLHRYWYMWVGQVWEKRYILSISFSAINCQSVRSFSLTKRRCTRWRKFKPTGKIQYIRAFYGSLSSTLKWADLMISFYSNVWLFAVILIPWKHRLKPLSWRGFTLFLPMTLDGGTHAISDLAGLGEGFRDTNQWLAVLTNKLFPVTFCWRARLVQLSHATCHWPSRIFSKRKP